MVSKEKRVTQDSSKGDIDLQLESGAVIILADDGETKQQKWDFHSSYQWTYFTEQIKQLIDFYLENKLNGRNLDIGGGWYLPYKNSDVVDLSSVALQYNMAPKERKHVFDLDEISNGKRLPFEDGTFDSATMISVIQYLQDPWTVIKEMQRVLKPEAELYVIGAQDAGLPELRAHKGFDNMNEVSGSFLSENYDIMKEPIPTSGGSTTEFSSIRIAMPDVSGASTIKDREKKRQEIRNFSAEEFLSEWVKQEYELEVSKLMQIQRYPITTYAKRLLDRIEAFTNEYKEASGDIPVFFHEGIPQSFHMSLQGDQASISVATIARKESDKYKGVPDELLKRHGLNVCNHIGTLPGTKEYLDYALRKPDNEDKTHFMNFMSTTKLNSSAIELQKRIEESMLPCMGMDYFKYLYESHAAKLYSVASQYKQRRRIDELIEKRKMIESDPKLIHSFAEIDIGAYLQSLKEIIDPRKNVSIPYYD